MMIPLQSQIEEFLDECEGFICIEDLHYILNFMNILDEFENKECLESIHGEHFRDCPWSQDSCMEGPDTCQCTIFKFRKNRIINLMDMYNKFLED